MSHAAARHADGPLAFRTLQRPTASAYASFLVLGRMAKYIHIVYPGRIQGLHSTQMFVLFSFHFRSTLSGSDAHSGLFILLSAPGLLINKEVRI